MTETVWPDDILENAGVVSSNLPISCEWLRSSPECPMCRVSEDLDSVLIPHPISCVTMWCGWCGHALLHSVIYLSGRKKKVYVRASVWERLRICCALWIGSDPPSTYPGLPPSPDSILQDFPFFISFEILPYKSTFFFCWHFKKILANDKLFENNFFIKYLIWKKPTL